MEMLLVESHPHLPLYDCLLFAAACAFASHLVFNRFVNKFDQSRFFPLAVLLLLGVLPSLPVVFLRPHLNSLRTTILVGYLLYYAFLVLSVVTYRISPFHPLARYPGPLLAKISKFRGIWITICGNQHRYFKELHEIYGPYVRVGPNELSFLDVDSITPIMGMYGLPKGPMWDGRRHPDSNPSLIAVRNLKEHSIRRKMWDRAFSTASVKDYEPTIITRALQLAYQLEKRANGTNGGAVDLAKWISFFTFDFMGDMAFGGGFELMRDDDKNGLWHLMESGLSTAAIFGHIPWATPVVMRMSFLIKDSMRMWNFAIERTKIRKEEGSHMKDIFHHLIDEDGVRKTPPCTEDIVSDGILAIIAGSDTISTVTSNLFFYILHSPLDYRRLRAEVDTAFPPGEGDPFDAGKLAEMPFLNAVINETLRLQPPVVSGSQRAPAPGSGGKLVGKNFVPEGTAIFIPTYALQRDPRYFSPMPDIFWPERWLHANGTSINENAATSDLDVVINHSAFIPFSYGPANCAGKNLALVEMRMVVCLLLQRFDMRFAEGYDPGTWEEGLEDWYVMKNGKLPVVLKARV